MVEVRVGQIIQPKDIKCGTGKGGAWAFGRVTADKGYDSVTVWFNNAEDYKEMHSYKVVKIESVKMSARKVKTKTGNEEWVKEASCNAIMEMCDGEAPEGFAALDEECPF